jgi:hypothetical protein
VQSGQKTVAEVNILVQRAKSIGRNHFRPGYALANLGTRPIPWMFVLERQFSVEISR